MTREHVVVRAVGLCKSYGKLEALNDVSFEVAPGDVLGLLGRNGAGKSTTLGLLLGFIAPTRGSVSVFGLAATEPRGRGRIGYLPEAPLFPDHHSPLSLLEFHATLLGVHSSERSDRAAAALQEAGLSASSARSVRALSKGQLQRLALAVALLGDPGLLILDEPSSNLDPVGCRELRERVLARARAGSAVIFASHVLSEIEATCNRVIILERGRVASSGCIDDLCFSRGASLEQLFFESVDTLEPEAV